MSTAASGFCPQCGAEVSLEMGDPLLRCRYCRTSLYMVPSDGIFRYILNITDTSEHTAGLVWLPYWRFRGLRYSVGPGDSIGTYMVDTTVSAAEVIPDSSSLGIVPQAAGVRLAAGTAGLPTPGINLRSALMAADVRLRTLEDTPARLYRFVGETRTLIYAPFRIIDRPAKPDSAILRALWGNRATFPVSMDKVQHAAKNTEQTARTIKFLPLICPECAGPLPDESNALTLHCPRCSTLWGVHGRTFARLDFTCVMPSDTACRPDSFLPFWNLNIELKNFPMNSRADMRRMLVSWKPVPHRWEKENIQLIIPAFKLNPGLFLRIASNLSLSDIETEAGSMPFPHGYTCHPVRLPIEEAAQAAKVVLASMFRRQKKLLPLLPDTKLEVKRIRLLFLPFETVGRDLVQYHTGISITKRAMELGGTI